MFNALNTDRPMPSWRHYRGRCDWLRDQWQALAREARVLDAAELADACQRLADYWAAPFWRQLATSWALVLAERELLRRLVGVLGGVR